MTDRTDRGPRGRSKGPVRPGRGGRPSKDASPRSSDRTRDDRTDTRADGTPHSKRFGKRPPKAGRTGGTSGDKTQGPSFNRESGRGKSEGRSARPEGPSFKSRGPGFNKEDRGTRSEGPRSRSDREERRERPDTRGGRAWEKKSRGPGFKPREGDNGYLGRRAEPVRGDRNDRDDRVERGTERPAGQGRPRNNGWERRPSTSSFKGKRPSSSRSSAPREGNDDGYVRLNRYLAHSGVASRRDADDLIKAGVVTVNGKVVTELGTKVGPGDTVHYGGQKLSAEKKRYVLLNKPKDFITTTDDPRDRRTVMALIDHIGTERLYPVGRLDRHTTGVLLMTNDGDLAKKLTHPSHGAEKVYHATLDKNVTKAHLDQLVEGVELEDGMAMADEASYVDGVGKREVGLKLHMGRNRVVRRMFEALGYDVVKLDRVMFAGLTKKDIPRGKCRELTDREVLFLTKRK